ncbi:MAG: response regulator [Vicinamibacterales bacterium]
MTHKLLLADDSVTIQRVIELTFADEDVTVVSVGDGQQAIDRIPHERPDIVLVDVDMPRQNGYQVAQFVKGQPSLAHIPVLLLTGAFEPVDERKARAAGCDGVLSKPFEPQMLIARVKELLSGGSGLRGTAAGGPPAEAGDWQGKVQAGESVLAAGFQPPVTAGGQEMPGLALPSGEESAAVPLDEYFDRLDAAFANLAGAIDSHAVADPASGHQAWPEEDSQPASWMEDVAEPRVDVDLTAWADPGGAFDEPGSVDLTGALEAPDATPDGPALETGVPEAAASSAGPAAPEARVPLARAFSAFLAAEHGVPLPPSFEAGIAAPVVLDEATLEAVTRRVITELGGETLRATVADAVSRVAERVVREEIERLRRMLG